MASESYKASKEAFVSGMTGSSIMHVNMISAVALSSIALNGALRTRFPAPKSLTFHAEWIILILPLLLSVTLFADRPGLLSTLLLIPTGVLLLLPPREHGTFLPSASTSRPSSPTRPSHRISLPYIPPEALQSFAIPPLPALTTYRAHMMLMTVLCILAVDFPVFPRSLAKCETFGVSLMDLGVGSFVFSQGIISAIPLIKDVSYLTSPMLPKLLGTSRKILPIIVLGVVRVLLVKGTEYPEHESEYGAHWNFFITLALLPLLQVFLHPFIARFPISLVGALVALMQQVTLSALGARSFVLNAPRANVFSANKEGIVSLMGYMAIHLLGLSAGTLLLPPSPSFFRRRQQMRVRTPHRRDSSGSDSDDDSSTSTEIVRPSMKRQSDKAAIELCSYSVVWWTLLGISRLVGIDGGVSRRMANMPYILWIAAFNTLYLCGYIWLDLYFSPSPLKKSKSVYSSPSKLKVPVEHTLYGDEQYQTQDPAASAPELLAAINKNGLPIFLLANIATGLINLTIPTMYTNDFWAITVLALYAFGICVAAWVLRERRLW